MATYKAVVLKGTNDKKSDGTTNIKIRITKGKSTNYLATDMFILPSYMDNKAGAVRLGPSKDFINARIAGLLKTYREKDMELSDRRDYMTVSEIKQHLLSGKSNEIGRASWRERV